MTLNTLTERKNDYKVKTDVVPVLSREFNLVVDQVNTNTTAIAADVAAGVTLTGVQTLTNKTLTEPKFADLGFIADPTGAEMLVFDAATTPVNYFKISNSPTLTSLGITALGTDTDISISYNTKGSGAHRFQEQSATGDTIAILPQTGGANPFTGYITSADLTADKYWTFPNLTGTVALTTSDGHVDGQVFLANAFNCPAPGTDWTPDITGVTLGANLSAKKVWIPLNFLKIADEIVSYKIVGDATEAAAITLDCKLVVVNKADPLTTTDVAGGGIVQVDADGVIDVEATLSAIETVATDHQYVLEVLGTTGAGDSITIIGAEVTVNRNLV